MPKERLVRAELPKPTSQTFAAKIMSAITVAKSSVALPEVSLDVHRAIQPSASEPYVWRPHLEANMLIGVICEVITAVAAAEKEAIQITFVKDTLLRVMGRTLSA